MGSIPLVGAEAAPPSVDLSGKISFRSPQVSQAASRVLDLRKSDQGIDHLERDMGGGPFGRVDGRRGPQSRIRGPDRTSIV